MKARLREIAFRVQRESGGGIQRSAKRLVRGCEKFVPSLAYLFCLALPGSCLARFANLFADLCISFISFGGILTVESSFRTLSVHL